MSHIPNILLSLANKRKKQIIFCKLFLLWTNHLTDSNRSFIHDIPNRYSSIHLYIQGHSYSLLFLSIFYLIFFDKLTYDRPRNRTAELSRISKQSPNFRAAREHSARESRFPPQARDTASVRGGSAVTEHRAELRRVEFGVLGEWTSSSVECPPDSTTFTRWVGWSGTRCHVGGAPRPPWLSVCWRGRRCTERCGEGSARSPPAPPAPLPSVESGVPENERHSGDDPVCFMRFVGGFAPGSRQQRSWNVVVALPSRAPGTPQRTAAQRSEPQAQLRGGVGGPKWGSVWWQSCKILVGHKDFFYFVFFLGAACGPCQNFAPL